MDTPRPNPGLPVQPATPSSCGWRGAGTLSTPGCAPAPTCPGDAVRVRGISANTLGSVVATLAELLAESVNAGAALGFLPPFSAAQALEYWLSLYRDLLAGTRLLFVAEIEDRIVGSGQLALAPWPNTRHRAELQKLFVAGAMRGHGVGKALLRELHRAAWQRGRSLILLTARRGDAAEAFYQRCGYEQAGIIPGATLDSTGRRHDNVTMYQELSPPAAQETEKPA